MLALTRFLEDIKDHRLTVRVNRGTDRHLHFSKPGSIDQSFDLVTWPGHLCYTGDMGTYVFERLPDMFTFFRMKEGVVDPALPINPGLVWGIKQYDQCVDT